MSDTGRVASEQALVNQARAGLGRPGFDPSRVRRSFSKPPHPADGLVARVNLGDGAWSCILDPNSFEDGGIVWRLTWGNTEQVRYVAASVIESYDYLLSGSITTKEAISRLRLLRAARRYLCDSDGSRDGGDACGSVHDSAAIAPETPA